MSDANGQAWGMCAAFGCPLFGTMGSDGGWYCFCHAGKPSVFNDAITRELRENQIEVVDITLQIRRDSIRGGWSHAMRELRVALRQHPDGTSLAFSPKTDGNASAWLLRLERHLIQATADIGQQKRIASTVPTAQIIGPTHVSKHHPYGDGANA
ncbi:hypothetical protein PQR01_00320 [Paraburkholderia rhynchosiae]|uniref:Uncharacterized protein n=1 Tax=Paraburkholderia rhynchosiae TaxID=487049 RepID=A0ACC7N4L2_9BURK